MTGSGIQIHPDSSLVTSPNQTPLPAPEPVVAAPAPATAARSLARGRRYTWPENVPSLKPGTGSAGRHDRRGHGPGTKAVAGTGRRAPSDGRDLDGATKAARTGTENQVAALPPQQPMRPLWRRSRSPCRPPSLGRPAAARAAAVVRLQAGDSNKKIGLQVATMNGPRGEFSLPPGDYVVTVKQRKAVVSQPLTVGTAGGDQDAGDQHLDRRRPDDPLYRRQDRDGAGALGGLSSALGRPGPIRRSPMPWRLK